MNQTSTQLHSAALVFCSNLISETLLIKLSFGYCSCDEREISIIHVRTFQLENNLIKNYQDYFGLRPPIFF